MEADRWPGRPMRELVRTVAAKYAKGDRICLDLCPDPGTVADVRLVGTVYQYRARWDSWPNDDQWYDEECVRPWEAP